MSRPARKTLGPGFRRDDDRTVGLFNPVHPWTTQVLGDAGAAYLSGLAPPGRAALARQLARGGMKRLVLARGVDTGRREWTAAGIAVTRDRRPAHEIVHALRLEALARVPHATLHGVLLRVHGVGVLLEGPAGAGKSALALELVGRGHALVADDAVELTRPAAGIVLGQGSRLLRGYLETRGLGVLDVRRMHGAGALRPRARVSLIVRLGGRRQLTAADRLGGRRRTRRLLGEALPVLALPGAASRAAKGGHNLAVLVEAACLDQRLREEGFEAAGALGRRQARAIARTS